MVKIKKFISSHIKKLSTLCISAFLMLTTTLPAYASGVNDSAETALRVPDGTTIVLKGTNTITSTYNGEAATNGIYASGALTIQGTGSLVVAAGAIEGSNKKSTGIFCADRFTVSGGIITASGANNGILLDLSAAVSGGVVIADGGDYGICAEGGVLSVTGDGTVVIKGSASALYLADYAGNPSNADVLGINASGDAYDVATMYSDSEGPRQLITAEDRADVTHAIIVEQGITPPTPLALAEMAIPTEPTPDEPTPTSDESTPTLDESTPTSDEPTPDEPNKENPKTGDNSSIIPVVFVLLLSGILAVIFGRKNTSVSSLYNPSTHSYMKLKSIALSISRNIWFSGTKSSMQIIFICIRFSALFIVIITVTNPCRNQYFH